MAIEADSFEFFVESSIDCFKKFAGYSFKDGLRLVVKEQNFIFKKFKDTLTALD